MSNGSGPPAGAPPPPAPAAQRPVAPQLGARMRVVLDKVGKTRSMFQMAPPAEPTPLPDLEQIFTYTRVPDTLRRPGLKFFKRFQTVDSCSGESAGEGGSLPGSLELSRGALGAQGSTISSNCTLPCRADSKASAPELAELPEPKEASGEHSATSNNAKRFPTIYLHYYPETGWAWVVAVCALLAGLLLGGLQAASGLLLLHCRRLQFQHVQQPELGKYHQLLIHYHRLLIYYHQLLIYYHQLLIPDWSVSPSPAEAIQIKDMTQQATA